MKKNTKIMLGIAFVILAVLGIYSQLFSLYDTSYPVSKELIFKGTETQKFISEAGTSKTTSAVKEYTIKAYSPVAFDNYIWRRYSNSEWWWVENKVNVVNDRLTSSIGFGLHDDHCYALSYSMQNCVVFEQINLKDVQTVELQGKVTLSGRTYKCSSCYPYFTANILSDGSKQAQLFSRGQDVRYVIDGHWESYNAQIVNLKLTNAGNYYVISDYSGNPLGSVEVPSDSKIDTLSICSQSVYTQGCTTSQANTGYEFSALRVLNKDKTSVCGNEVVEFGEVCEIDSQCDDNNTDTKDTCSSCKCTNTEIPPVCGDGKIGRGEVCEQDSQCDDNKEETTDLCKSCSCFHIIPDVLGANLTEPVIQQPINVTTPTTPSQTTGFSIIEWFSKEKTENEQIIFYAIIMGVAVIGVSIYVYFASPKLKRRRRL